MVGVVFKEQTLPCWEIICYLLPFRLYWRLRNLTESTAGADGLILSRRHHHRLGLCTRPRRHSYVIATSEYHRYQILSNPYIHMISRFLWPFNEKQP